MNYPQKPEFLGEGGSIGGKVLTLQMLKPYTNETVTKNGVTCVCNGDGTYTLSGTSEDYTSFPLGGLNHLNLGRYYLSIFDNLGRIGFQVVGANPFDSFGQNMNKPIEITTKDSSTAYIVILSAGINCDGIIIRPMISKEPIEYYEPYTEQPFTSITPKGLRGIPLGQTIPDAIKNSPIHMSGVYWDGEQYQIADTENENGKDVQRIGETIFNGDEYFVLGGGETDEILPVCVMGDTFGIYRLNAGFCDKFILGDEYTVKAGQFDIRPQVVTEYNLRFYVPKSIAKTVDEFKVHIAENPITLTHILAEPIVTETDVQCDVVMNYPNTTIVNDEGAYMEITAFKKSDTLNHTYNTFVDSTSDQTVGGVKTFADGIRIGNATVTHDTTNHRLIITIP